MYPAADSFTYMPTTLRSAPLPSGWPLRKRSAMILVEVSQQAFFIMSGSYLFNMSQSETESYVAIISFHAMIEYFFIMGQLSIPYPIKLLKRVSTIISTRIYIFTQTHIQTPKETSCLYVSPFSEKEFPCLVITIIYL